MDRYQRVEKPRAETPIDANEIRITSQGRMRNYITYAMSLLQEEKGSSEIVFKAMGRAINKTVTIVELIKRRIVGLHQNTSIGSTDITDTWEPLEEGLLPLETTRHVSMIIITLSKKELNTSSVGYQPPLPVEQRAHQMVVVGAAVAEEGQRLEGMVLCRLIMRTEEGTGVEVMLGVVVVEEGVVFVAVEGGGMVDLRLIHNKMEDTIEKHLFKAVDVAVGGVIVEEAVALDPMCRSRQLHDTFE
ncbi:hypothetical protein I3760_07G143700 [Carya illinoinensis]|nr:hypothetical protein I3760_07G143700 [Carya illinoinensis]